MDDHDREWITRWRAYLDGFPPQGWEVDTLEEDLAMITSNILTGEGRHREVYTEVGRTIAEKLKEREAQGEPICPTTPSVLSTLP